MAAARGQKALWIFGAIQIIGTVLTLRGGVHDGTLLFGAVFLLPGSLIGLAVDSQIGSAADKVLVLIAVLINSAVFFLVWRRRP